VAFVESGDFCMEDSCSLLTEILTLSAVISGDWWLSESTTSYTYHIVLISWYCNTIIWFM